MKNRQNLSSVGQESLKSTYSCCCPFLQLLPQSSSCCSHGNWLGRLSGKREKKPAPLYCVPTVGFQLGRPRLGEERGFMVKISADFWWIPCISILISELRLFATQSDHKYYLKNEQKNLRLIGVVIQAGGGSFLEYCRCEETVHQLLRALGTAVSSWDMHSNHSFSPTHLMVSGLQSTLALTYFSPAPMLYLKHVV